MPERLNEAVTKFLMYSGGASLDVPGRRSTPRIESSDWLGVPAMKGLACEHTAELDAADDPATPTIKTTATIEAPVAAIRRAESPANRPDPRVTMRRV